MAWPIVYTTTYAILSAFDFWVRPDLFTDICVLRHDSSWLSHRDEGPDYRHNVKLFMCRHKFNLIQFICNKLNYYWSFVKYRNSSHHSVAFRLISGSTAERICLAGDSAGGNLMTSTLIRAISVGIRLPDGIMAAYTPFNIRYTPSPSRLFSLMDPLLPVGILSRCLAGKGFMLPAHVKWTHSLQSIIPRRRKIQIESTSNWSMVL